MELQQEDHISPARGIITFWQTNPQIILEKDAVCFALPHTAHLTNKDANNIQRITFKSNINNDFNRSTLKQNLTSSSILVICIKVLCYIIAINHSVPHTF